MRPSKTIDEMHADAHLFLVNVQGFRHVAGLDYEGAHYAASITDKPGMTRNEKAQILGLPMPSCDGDMYDCVTIEYKIINPIPYDT